MSLHTPTLFSKTVTKLLAENRGCLDPPSGGWTPSTYTSGFPLYVGFEPELPPFMQATSNYAKNTFYLG